MTKTHRGHFGKYGGQFVPETLMTALGELEEAYSEAKEDPKFQMELNRYSREYAGRPTPLYEAQSLGRRYGCRVYLKREDLCHTGSHKLNNTLGQGLLARRMGKKRVIAETGAGQHGVATATAAALFGMECDVYMGAEDIHRQSLNVFRMKLLGAKVIPVTSGSCTLKDAINEAMRDWVTNVADTYYVLGSVVGPHPYPSIVRDFQSVIGRETKEQIRLIAGKLPDYVIACVGGGSNSMGIFQAFLPDDVKFVGVEAAGLGLESGKHGASLGMGSQGVLHGSMSYVLQDEFGQITPAHSISAGLDYPGVGPEHAHLKDSGRVAYESVTDKEALAAFKLLSEEEGIIPALESAHALAYLEKMRGQVSAQTIVVVNLSGRGDKDVQVVAEAMGEEL